LFPLLTRMSNQETRELPQHVQDLILEYIQDPDEMILLHHGRPMINRASNKTNWRHYYDETSIWTTYQHCNRIS
jgi:hypothetical protein